MNKGDEKYEVAIVIVIGTKRNYMVIWLKGLLNILLLSGSVLFPFSASFKIFPKNLNYFSFLLRISDLCLPNTILCEDWP